LRCGAGNEWIEETRRRRTSQRYSLRFVKRPPLSSTLRAELASRSLSPQAFAALLLSADWSPPVGQLSLTPFIFPAERSTLT